MALHALLLIATMALAQEGSLEDGSTPNAQNNPELHIVLSTIVQTMATAATTLQSDEESEAALEGRSQGDSSLLQLTAATRSPDVCYTDDCSPPDSDSYRTRRESFTAVEAPLDALIDFAIGFAVHKYALIHGGRIPMEDVGKGRLRLTNGSIGDLRDVFRHEPVSLRRALFEGQQALLLTFTGGFRFVDVLYRYHYTIPLFSHSGDVQGSLSPVVVLGQLLLQLPCEVRLLRLHISHMGDLSLNGTGFWPLNGFVFGLLRDLAAKTVRGALLNVVGDIRRQIQAALDDVDCSL